MITDQEFEEKRLNYYKNVLELAEKMISDIPDNSDSTIYIPALATASAILLKSLGMSSELERKLFKKLINSMESIILREKICDTSEIH